MADYFELLALFFSSLLAATIFPTQSEMVLVAMSLGGKYSSALLLTIATVGNVLGSLFNWLLGFYIAKFKDKKYFPVNEKQLSKYSKIYEKWGVWSLLLAWVPIIGDPLTVVAGIFRTNIWLFLLLVTIGKFTRYFILIISLQ